MLLRKMFGPKREAVTGMRKVMLLYVMTTCAGVEVQLHSFLTSSQTGVECQLHGPGHYSPWESLLYRLNWRLQMFGAKCGEGVVLCGGKSASVF
jgi:hypothetical protein